MTMTSIPKSERNGRLAPEDAYREIGRRIGQPPETVRYLIPHFRAQAGVAVGTPEGIQYRYHPDSPLQEPVEFYGDHLDGQILPAPGQPGYVVTYFRNAVGEQLDGSVMTQIEDAFLLWEEEAGKLPYHHEDAARLAEILTDQVLRRDFVHRDLYAIFPGLRMEVFQRVSVVSAQALASSNGDGKKFRARFSIDHVREIAGFLADKRTQIIRGLRALS